MKNPIQFLNHPSLARPNGFSHVTSAPPGNLVFVSGQVSYDPQGNIVGPNDLAVQTRRVFENLKAALEQAGSDFNHTLKFTFFVKDMTEEAIATIRRVRAEFLCADQPPASTMVGVAALARRELLLEVEAYAIVAPR